jgi:hypothetical protein
VRRRGAHKDGLSCNRGSTQNITGSRVRHDGSNDGVTTVAVEENCTRAWHKGQRVDAMAADQK